MRRTPVVAMGLLCLSALKPSSLVAGEKSVESAKAASGLRFLESGKGQSGVGEPSAVRAAAETSRVSGLTLSIASKRSIDSFQVPAPAAAAQNEASAPSHSWSKLWKTGSALVGGAAAAVVAIPFISAAGLSAAVAVLVGGSLIAAGAVGGYAIAALAERAARR